MSNARAFVSWSMVLVVSMVGACGGAAELTVEPGDDRSTDAGSHSERGDQSTFEAAKDALRNDNTGRFVREVWLKNPRGKNEIFLRSRGRYDVSKHRSRARATATDPTGKNQPFKFQYASNARRVFMHAPAWSCWLALTPENEAAGMGLEPSPGIGRLPAEIAALLRARTTFDWDDATVIDATVPVRFVASLAGSYIYQRLSGKVAGARVPAKIHIKSGRFVAWTVRGRDIMTELLPHLDPTKRLRKLLIALQAFTFHVELSDAGAQLRVPIPPRSDWVEPEPGAKRFNPNACGSDPEVV